MPDTQPIPTEHIYAVADEISGTIIGIECYSAQIGVAAAREAAETILASTDPGVLDALTAALVRAGRLTEEWTVLRSCGCRRDPRSVNSCCISAALGDVTQVRLVSGWQEVTE